MPRSLTPFLDRLAKADHLGSFPQPGEAERELRALKAVVAIALGGHACSSISCDYCQRMGRALSRLHRQPSRGSRGPGRDDR